MAKKSEPLSAGEIEIAPLTLQRWADFETLFGVRGACAGCWCMFWRLKRSEFSSLAGEGTRAAMRELVTTGETPGLLAYVGGNPVGWVALGPREGYPTLARSRVLKPVDDLPVWSVVCFFVARGYRRRGVTGILLNAALTFARQNGAQVVEAYPIEPKAGSYPDTFAYTGLASTFRAAGFSEVVRRSPTRPIMRYFFPEP